MCSSDTPREDDLPTEVEDLAAQILLGDSTEVDARFESLCAAHESLRTPLQLLRTRFERAANLFADGDCEPTPLPGPIGPYRFLRHIGEGAFGTVFLAEQEAPIRRQVAIKILNTMAGSPGAIARFLNERETLARMNHPAIARIYDAGVDGSGRPYFVMEYVPGEPLNRFVANRGADLTARLELFLAACEGVNHAHQRGVIHRDLKPQNILVGEVDDRWLPKVIDFGLAKVFEGDTPVIVRTQAGTVLGTPAYMSPEQLQGSGDEVDTRTDVYALGVILYELLASSLPIAVDRLRNAGLVDLRDLLAAGEPPLVSVRAAQSGMPYARSLRGDIDWILRKAMARAIDERYASVAAFAADVRAFLAHMPVSAGPPTPLYRLRKFARRHLMALVATGLVLGSLMLGLVTSTILYRSARQYLGDYERLADVVELEDLQRTADRLWPSMPERLGEHERWLARARELLQRRNQHAETVRTLENRLGASAVPALTGNEAGAARFLLEQLQHHVASLDDFAADGGALHSMERRTEFARTVMSRSIDEHRAEWDRAIAAVAADPRHHGLVLAPVPGLVPLGADPGSGLQEFAHMQSGTVPARAADGQLVLGDETAIVLVLVPGGDHEVGSQSTDENAPLYDPYRQPSEGPPETARLAPYLLGKYELTQGQVLSLGLPLQATGRMGTQQPPEPPITGRHPEESVRAPEVAAWLPHFGLRLPDGLEWEVAARAGSREIWGVGKTVTALQGYVNVADATLADQFPHGIETDRSVRDGRLGPAPVGSYSPNPWGFHDMLGNVAEMTIATNAMSEELCLARGGSYLETPVDCRVGAYRYVPGNLTSHTIGVRVAMSLPTK